MSGIGNGSPMHCPYCGTAVTGRGRFCAKCGSQLPDEVMSEMTSASDASNAANVTAPADVGSSANANASANAGISANANAAMNTDAAANAGGPAPATGALPPVPLPPMATPTSTPQQQTRQQPQETHGSQDVRVRNPGGINRTTVIITAVIAVVIVVAAIVGFVVWRTSRERAVASCQESVLQLKDSQSDLNKIIGEAQQVADAAGASDASSTLSETLKKAQKAADTAVESCVSDPETVRNTADALRTTIASIRKTLTGATTEQQKQALADAKSKLKSVIDTATSTLNSSDGKVDDQTVRDALSKALDNANKLLDSGTSVKALDEAADALDKARGAVDAAVTKWNAEDDSRCSSIAGDYFAGLMGGNPVLSADCTVQMVSEPSPDNIIYTTEGSYVPGTFHSNADGTMSWSGKSSSGATGAWTYYPTGSAAPVPNDMVSYWDENSFERWREYPVLIGPESDQCYTAYSR